jgi:hypothetical protein
VSRHLLGALVALGATFVMSAATASAAPAFPVDREQRQPDGSIVTLRPWGDESAGGWETRDGFRVVRGEPTSRWDFAILDNLTGKLKASVIQVGSRIAFEARFLGRCLAYTYEVRVLEPGARLIMSTDQGPFPDGDYLHQARHTNWRHAHDAAEPWRAVRVCQSRRATDGCADAEVHQPRLTVAQGGPRDAPVRLATLVDKRPARRRSKGPPAARGTLVSILALPIRYEVRGASGSPRT